MSSSAREGSSECLRNNTQGHGHFAGKRPFRTFLKDKRSAEKVLRGIVNYPALSGGASCFMDNTCTTEM